MIALVGCRPVFVVGMNGSGTTMLADSLGMHPDLYMFPHEVRLLPYLIRRAGRLGDLTDYKEHRRLADELWRSKPFWHVRRRVDAPVPESCLRQPSLAATIDALFAYHAAAAGKRRWGEKSPMNVLHMELLARSFPGAQFVHIVRDGRDAAQSFHRRFGYIPCETVYRWKRVVREGVRQGQVLGPESYHQIRYEDLTAEPEKLMLQVCDFLHLPFDDRVMQASMRMADPELLRAGARISQNSGKWARYFSATEVQSHERLAGKQLKAMGYGVAIEGDEEPARWRLAWWRCRSILSRSVVQVRSYGWKSLGAYWRSAAVSRKQAKMGRM